MRIVKQLIIVAMSALALAGCHKSMDENLAMGGSSSDAQARGMIDRASYQAVAERRDSNGKIINPLKAPTNQTYYFHFDRNQVMASDFAAIRLQASYLAVHPGAKVRLEGNTDDIGSREYNVALGWRRDQAIAHVLTQYGARRSQLDMVSYGKEQPAVAGENERARRLNRRVSLVYEGY